MLKSQLLLLRAISLEKDEKHDEFMENTAIKRPERDCAHSLINIKDADVNFRFIRSFVKGRFCGNRKTARKIIFKIVCAEEADK